MNSKLDRRPTGAFLIACLLSALLTACGGGGGSGGAGSPGTVPSVSTGTGLLPSPVVLGATLADDASTWRPLNDKAVYSYRGKHSIQGSAQPDSFYEDVVTQAAQSGGTVENSTNAYNDGPDTTSAPVLVQAGAVTQQVPFQFAAGGATLTLDYVELRSPIRTNDRYVITDHRIADIGVDVDGDKKNDGLDLAVWVQVVGEEMLDLPYRKAVRTIRTEATIRARIVPSSGIAAPAAVDVRLTVWYAADIGPVKVRRDSPHPNNDQWRVIDEETLVTYDGIVGGVGSSANVQMLRTSAGEAIPLAYDAAGFDDHIVTISNLPGTYPAAGFMLTEIGPRGALMAATAFPVAGLPEPVYNPRLLRLGDELRLVYVGNGGVSMLRISADGQTLLSKTPIVLQHGPLGQVPYLSQFPFKAATSQGALWLVTTPYVGSDTIPQARLELRRFDAAGSQVGAPQAIESGNTAYGVSALDMSASASQLVMTWYHGTPAAGPRHMIVDATTGLSVPTATASGLSDLGPACQAQGLPLALSANNLVACGAYASSAVTLGANGLPLTNADGSIRNDSLLPADWSASSGVLNWVTDAQRLSFFGRRFEKLWPEDSLESSFFQFAEIPLVSSGPDITAYRMLGRVLSKTLQPQFAFTLGNRVLVIGSDCNCQTGVLGTTIVWR